MLHSKILPVVVCAAVAFLAGCGNAQSRKASYFKQGQQYFEAGNLDKARVEFRNAAQIDPKDGNVAYMLGQLAERAGDVRSAAGFYKSAIDDDPKLAAPRAALGRIYIYANAADKAVELVQAGLQTAPQDPQLLTIRGAARQKLGDKDGAMSDAQTAVKGAPSDPYAIAVLSSLYRDRGQFVDAESTINAGLQRLPNNVDLRVILASLLLEQRKVPETEAQLKQIVALEPKTAANRLRLARFYFEQKNLDAAEQTLRDAVKAVPSQETKLELVRFLAAQRGAAPAQSQIDQLLSQSPDDYSLKLVLGQFEIQSGLSERGEKLYQDVIARAGDKAEGLTARDLLANQEMRRNDTVDASKLVSDVLEKNARDNNALLIRSQISANSGDYGAAITDLRAVLRDQPNSVVVMRQLAAASLKNGEYDSAEQTLRTAAQLAPKDTETQFDLAEALAQSNKLDQANAVLQQLKAEHPTDIAVQRELFEVQLRQKNVDAALVVAQNIEQADAKSPVGFYLAGLALEIKSNFAEAMSAYEHALEIQPKATDVLAALTKLQLQQKQAPQAQVRVEAAIAAEPQNAMLRVLRGNTLAAQGNIDAALESYSEAIKISPQWSTGYLVLANAQVQRKMPEDAVTTLRSGIAIIQPLPSDLVTVLGRLYEQLKRPDDAIAMYENVLQKNAHASFAENNLAMLLVTYKTDGKDITRAQALADSLSGLSMVDVIDTRGWVRFKSGDYHGAESLLQQAVDKEPTAAELRYHLAAAQFRSGESRVAQQNLEAALQSNQSFSEAADARALLLELKKQMPSG